MSNSKINDAREVQIERINLLSRSARVTWYSLNIYVLFAVIVILTVKDMDFFVIGREISLPLLRVSIPTASFFIAGPLLGTSIYIFLHLQLRKLWEAIMNAHPKPGGILLEDRIYPWLVNDLALILRGQGAQIRPLNWLSSAATRILVWVTGPAVLFGFWWRSMPAHDELLTIFICLSALLATHVGYVSWRRLVSLARGRTSDGMFRRATHTVIGAMIVVTAVAVSWLRTEGGFDYWATRTAEVVEKGFGLKIYDLIDDEDIYDWGRRNYLSLNDLSIDSDDANILVRILCRLDGQTDVGCTPLAMANLREVDFSAGGTALDLSRSDLRRAYLTAADLSGVVLTGARLDGAFLWETRLRETSLNGTWMQNADLRFADLSDAYLAEARMENTNLHAAKLDGAYMTSVNLSGARIWAASMNAVDLRFAQLNGVDLSRTPLKGVNFQGASLVGAKLAGADLRGSDFKSASCLGANFSGSLLQDADLRRNDCIDQTMLDQSIGNENTKLPEGFTIPSCWKIPPKSFEYLVGLEVKNDPTLMKEAVRAKWLCAR